MKKTRIKPVPVSLLLPSLLLADQALGCFFNTASYVPTSPTTHFSATATANDETGFTSASFFSNTQTDIGWGNYYKPCPTSSQQVADSGSNMVFSHTEDNTWYGDTSSWGHSFVIQDPDNAAYGTVTST